MPFFFDVWYFYLILPAMVLVLLAQMGVKSTYARYAKVRSRRGLTASQVARRILDANGLQHISIEQVAGNLTDHYDPRAGVIRLSTGVHNSDSVAAIGVAAHEAGHAVQHATGYFPIRVRNAILPAVQFGSTLAMPLFILGIVFSLSSLIEVGIVLFSLTVLFQFVTLPVEYNASSRAVRVLESTYVLEGDEVQGAKRVLRAAAMTYLASAAMALAQLLRLILLRGDRD